MSKRKKDESADASSAEDVEVELERVGVFLRHFKIVRKYGPSCMNSHVTSYRAGQLVWNEEEIHQLLEMGAPLRVYIHDVNISGCSN